MPKWAKIDFKTQYKSVLTKCVFFLVNRNRKMIVKYNNCNNWGFYWQAAFDRAVTDDCRMRLTCTYLQKYFNNHRLVEYEKLVI